MQAYDRQLIHNRLNSNRVGWIMELTGDETDLTHMSAQTLDISIAAVLLV